MALKLKFDPNLDYQQTAIQSVTGLFQGMAQRKSEFTVESRFALNESQIMTETGIANSCNLTAAELLQNIQTTQLQNHLPLSKTVNKDDFHVTVEMETGTGKTYVYLRSIFELHKQYGFTKFIIVVPSLAIREGVLKSLQIMQTHFEALYDNQPMNYFVYDSDKLGQVRNYATSNAIQIMVMNIGSFNKSFKDPAKEDKANIIHRVRDDFNGQRPIDVIANTNPIVIIDEPQSVDTTANSREAIASLNPLVTIRYSATHREAHHMIYRLDAVEAYEKRLVKKIEVLSLEDEQTFNKAYLKVVAIKKNEVKLELNEQSAKGIMSRKTRSVKFGADLAEITNNQHYANLIVSQIDSSDEPYIELSDGSRYGLNDGREIADEQTRKKAMIYSTVREHMKKELQYLQHGIKILSLFFIDRVDNYRTYNTEGNPQVGTYAVLLNEAINHYLSLDEFQPLQSHYDKLDFNQLQNGYFSTDKGRLKDTSGITKNDIDTYDLIMKAKERLLSLDEPCRFIFSHSALREGWDNPNVFQICTLNETKSTIKKRQEIGRGLRLCVNQEGDRLHEEYFNTLTVVANESYSEFVEALQKEVLEELSVDTTSHFIQEFAKLPIQQADGTITELNSQRAEQLLEHFKKQKYVVLKKKKSEQIVEYQPQLLADIKSTEFQLPENLAPFQAVVVKTLRTQAGTRQINNALQRKTVIPNPEVMQTESFQKLWKLIKRKTDYRATFKREQLLERSIAALNLLKIDPIIMTEERHAIELKRIEGVVGRLKDQRQVQVGDPIIFPMPDVVSELQETTQFTRKTLVEILTGMNSQVRESIQYNPQLFLEQATKSLRQVQTKLLEDNIEYYAITTDEFDIENFQPIEVYTAEQAKDLTVEITDETKTLYKYIACDSKIEKAYAQEIDHQNDVLMYFKLPDWFKIQTPIGNYNPDWAMVRSVNGQEQMYLVIETKGDTDIDELREREKLKIRFAGQHFDALNKTAEQAIKFKGPIEKYADVVADGNLDYKHIDKI